MIDKNEIKKLIRTWDAGCDAAWNAYYPILEERGEDHPEYGLAFAILCVVFSRWQECKDSPVPRYPQELYRDYREYLADFGLEEIEIETAAPGGGAESFPGGHSDTIEPLGHS